MPVTVNLTTSSPPQEVHEKANGIKVSAEGIMLTTNTRGGGDEIAFYPHSVIRSVMVEADD